MFMGATMTNTSVATEGKGSDGRFQRPVGVETHGKSIAIACLSAALESFIAARNLSRAQLAEDLCGMSESNFSKVANGTQGDFWALVYKLPGDIRADFYERLHETERVDALSLAMEQLNAAMFRVMRLTGAAHLPEKANRMAKVTEREQERKRA